MGEKGVYERWFKLKIMAADVESRGERTEPCYLYLNSAVMNTLHEIPPIIPEK